MDRDLIFKRKLSLHQYPVPGDLICFPNTAGYMMHFLESAGHGSTLAANLVFNEQENSLVFESRENE
jgi:diaminopimelate decarboxylase